MRVGGLLVYSCYCPSRWSDIEFRLFLDDLELSISTHYTFDVNLVIAGDFIAIYLNGAHLRGI